MTDSSRLVMSQGPEPGQTFILDQASTALGRDPGTDIVISDPQVSRQHARIDRRGDLTVIEDMGSTNGTFVNGVRLTSPHTLVNGDVINLGDTVTFTYHGPEIAATKPLGGQTVVAPTSPDYEPLPAPPLVPPAAPVPTPMTTPQPTFAGQPAAAAQPAEDAAGKKWLWIGCGCLVLLVILACVGVFVLDSLEFLPAFFYEPLRWLGFI